MDWLKEVKEAAEEVLDVLGQGYDEKVYEEALAHELRLRKIPYERQRNFEMLYKGYKVGEGRADLIVNPLWCGKGGKELVLELKAVLRIGDSHRRQAQVYMASLNIDKGAVLSFGDEVLLEVVSKPKREFQLLPVKPTKSKKPLADILKNAAEDVYNYFGVEFIYSESGKNIFPSAIGIELRLNGIDFSFGTYEVLYKHQPVYEYDFDFVFDDNAVANVRPYKNQEDIEEELEDLKFYMKHFKFENGYLICIPAREKDKVQLREVH
ncbi:MAG: GxxExxY protein [candidate division WOR-3 bacterium]|nr:GxxExxY protein [candidate division WOR-3 bacterium]